MAHRASLLASPVKNCLPVICAMSNRSRGGKAKRFSRNDFFRSLELDCTDLSNVKQCPVCSVFGCTSCDTDEAHSFTSIDGSNMNLELRMTLKRKFQADTTSSVLPTSSSSNAQGTDLETYRKAEAGAQFAVQDEGITLAEVSAAAFLAACREVFAQQTFPFHSIPPKHHSFVDPNHARILELLGSREIEFRSPLHEAVRRRDAVTVKILITAGACTESEDMHGETPLQIANDDECHSVLKHHAAVLALLYANPPTFLITTLVAQCAALSNALEAVPATAISLSAFDYDASFLWAPSLVRDAVLKWARDAFIVQLAAITQPFADLPDDCAGDILEFFQIAMTRRESEYVATHCSSPKARIWVRSIVVASIAMRVNARLISAVEEGDVRTVQDCLAKGAFVDSFDRYGDTALILATDRCHLDVFTTLLQAGADVNAVGFDKSTALVKATDFFRHMLRRNGGGFPSYEGSVAMVKLLLEAGANVNATDDDGKTALINFSGSFCDRTEVIGLLLDSGANINAMDKDGHTALSKASMIGFPNIAELLLKMGADKDARAKSASSALIYASEAGHTSIVKLLLEAGADTEVEERMRRNTALINASMNGHTAIVKLLLEVNANVDEKNDERDTALILASANGHSTIVRLLLKAGADRNARNDNGCTPLIAAASNGRAPVVKRLLKAGVDKEAQNHRGETALFCASLKPKTAALELLIKFGANKMATNNYGESALDRASLGGRTEVVALLGEYLSGYHDSSPAG